MVDCRGTESAIAIWICWLVILLPLEFSLQVNAAWQPSPIDGTERSGYAGYDTGSVRVISAYGEDAIEGYRRKSDKITLAAQATFGHGLAVEGANLEVFMNSFGLGTFQSCALVSNQSGLYRCEFTESNSPGPSATGSIAYKVNLANGTGIAGSATAVLVVDENAPTIRKLVASSEKTRERNISIDFDVADYAFGSTRGVGLYSVSLSIGQKTAYIYSYEGANLSNKSTGAFTKAAIAYEPLKVKSTLKKTISTTLDGDSGTYSICLEATDFFSQVSVECRNVELDVTPPVIETGKFSVHTSSGDEPTWVNAEPFPLIASMGFSGNDLDISSIRGDFSDLTLDGSYNNVIPTCTALGNNTFNCLFTFAAQINRTKPYIFKFSASDKIRNMATASASHTINYDNTGPIATGIMLSDYYGGSYVLGTQPAGLKVTFLETGIGMNLSNAYLDLSDLGLGVVRADSCSQGWDCYWNSISAAKASIGSLPFASAIYQTSNGSTIAYQADAKRARIKVSTDTEDDLGNHARASAFNVTIDVNPPKILSLNITPIPATSEFLNHTVAGDSINIKLRVTDFTQATLNISADDFIEGYEGSIDCSEEEKNASVSASTPPVQVCEYLLGPITKQGYYEGKLHIALSDRLGNVYRFDSGAIPVYGVLNNTNVTYWTMKETGCSPDPLDRETVSRVASNVFCSMELDSSVGAEIYDIKAGACREMNASGAVSGDKKVTTLTGYRWLGLQKMGSRPIVNLNLGTFDPKIDELHYVCTLYVRSKVGGQYITEYAENVNASIALGLFNSPAGEITKAVKEKAREIHETYVKGVGFEIVAYLNSFFSISSKLCQIGGTIAKVIQAWYQIQFLIGHSHARIKTVEATQIGKMGVSPALVASSQTMLATDSSLAGTVYGFKGAWGKVISKYCAFVDCKLIWGSESWQNAMKVLDKMLSLLSGNIINKWLGGSGKGLANGLNQAAQSPPTNTYKDGQIQSQTTSRLATDNGKGTLHSYNTQYAYNKGILSSVTITDSVNGKMQASNKIEYQANPNGGYTWTQTDGKSGAQINKGTVQSLPATAQPQLAAPVAPSPSSAVPASSSGVTFPVRAGQPVTSQQASPNMPNLVKQSGFNLGSNAVTAPAQTSGTAAPVAPASSSASSAAKAPASSQGTIPYDVVQYDSYGNPHYLQAVPAAGSSGQPSVDVNGKKYVDVTPKSKSSFIGDSTIQTSMGGFNVKENWVLSMVTLCIPGMLYNLEKYRQIQCQYGYCLLSSGQDGMPTYYCYENFDYSVCKFIFGPLFELMPFAGLLNKIQQLIVNILSSPEIIIDMVIDFVCNSGIVFKSGMCAADVAGGPPDGGVLCTTSVTGLYACQVYDTLNLFVEVYNDVKGYFDGNFFKFEFGPKSGYCKKFSELYDQTVGNSTN